MEPQSPPATDLSRDYLAALYSIRKWKTFFLMLAALSLLAHLGAFGASKLYPFESRRAAADAEDAAPTTTAPSEATPAPPAAVDRERADLAHRIASHGLPLTEFVGRVSVFLLTLTLLLAVLIALVGRFPVSGFVRAFFWSLVVLAIFLPWDRLTPLGARVPGVFFDVAALEAAPPGTTAPHAAISYLRFAGYPLVALFLLLTANGGFRRSFAEAQSRPGANIAMRVV